ncbi:MAG: STAS domain-containing protein [Deltaproteobacteria bacterium]|nr:STAS domain-containing protein [Deltaproteobacteria bacterium]
MQLAHSKHGKYLLIQAEGRLDASWSDLFSETLLKYIREGEHQVLVDASGLNFLSSAGIRSLLIVHKELLKVGGTFRLVRPTDFVRDTITVTGFGEWLRSDFPGDFPAESGEAGVLAHPDREHYVLAGDSGLTLIRLDKLFEKISTSSGREKKIAFGVNDFGFGVGEAFQGADSADVSGGGEFVAAAGHVALQPPDERGRPDYLIAEKEYIPELKCRQMLKYSGDMSHIFRFKPIDESPANEISKIIDTVFDLTGADAAGFVVLGEIEGLVGASLVHSADMSRRDDFLAWPDVRDRLSFCGERSYAHEQALITGIAARGERREDFTALYPMPSRPDLSVHIHAVVFPYQPLPNGRLELKSSVSRFFGGPPPRAVMHLIDDARPAIGLGESALIRGACWCGPVLNPEVLL